MFVSQLTGFFVMKIGAVLKAAVPVVVGMVIFAAMVMIGVKNDIPGLKDLREAFDA